MKRFWMALVISAALAAGAFTGCANAATTSSSASSASATATSSVVASAPSASANMSTAATTSTASSELPDTSDLFTDRDLAQVADTANATNITVKSGEDVTVSEEGVYVISGTAEDVTITVNADDAAKVQLVLNGVNITNSDSPAIHVTSADKVFVTTADGTTNTLSVTGTFATSADSNVDGVIFSKDDLVLNGQGTLTISSSANGIVGKDDVKVTGGTYNITAGGHGIQGKDSVAIADGTFSIKAGTDAIHSANDEDQTKGYVYIADGTFNLNADSDGIEGDAFVKIDGGTFDINAAEGIEGTRVQINDGTTTINASDDGVNATSKSTAYAVALEINGGNLTVNMAQGDTDALDANGDLIINGGTVNLNAQFAFDFDGKGELNGGTVYVNGEQITEIANSMMGGGGMGGGMHGGPNGSFSGQAPNSGFSGNSSAAPNGGFSRGSAGSQQTA